MTLLKTSFLSFIASGVKMLAALAIYKAVAIFIGPSGLALVGQFQNFNQLTMTAAQGGINAGVTRYTAEYGREGELLPALFSTAARINLICSLLVGASVILFAKAASQHFLNSPGFTCVFILFGITIPH